MSSISSYQSYHNNNTFDYSIPSRNRIESAINTSINIQQQYSNEFDCRLHQRIIIILSILLIVATLISLKSLVEYSYVMCVINVLCIISCMNCIYQLYYMNSENYMNTVVQICKYGVQLFGILFAYIFYFINQSIIKSHESISYTNICTLIILIIVCMYSFILYFINISDMDSSITHAQQAEQKLALWRQGSEHVNCVGCRCLANPQLYQ